MSRFVFEDILVVDDIRHHSTIEAIFLTKFPKWSPGSQCRIEEPTGIIMFSFSWKQKWEAKEIELNPHGHFSVEGTSIDTQLLLGLMHGQRVLSAN
jgi:hypothetical protein